MPPAHANLALGRSPHYTGFLAVSLPGSPGYARYPSAQVPGNRDYGGYGLRRDERGVPARCAGAL